MTTTCPHCQTEIDIDQPTLAALAGRSHFACPACQGAVAIHSRVPALASAHRGLNRNFLILGSMALLALGGLGFFLTSKKSGDTTTVNQNIRNEIINNNYFQNLIATGITTEGELRSIEDIRPFQNGFIGISAAKLGWQQANNLAKRTGAVVLEAGTEGESSSWAMKTFTSSSSSLTWIRNRGDVGLMTSAGAVALKAAEGEYKVLLHWRLSGQTDPAIMPPSSLADGLVAYYPFNGNAEDASGNGNIGIVENAVLAKDRFGNDNNSYRFNGYNSQIRVMDSFSFSTIEEKKEISIAFWAYWDGDGSYPSINKHSDSDWGWFFQYWNGNLEIGVSGEKDTDFARNGFVAVMPANTWTHLAVTFSEVSGKVEFFVDNILTFSGVTTYRIPKTSNNPLYIGFNPAGGDDYSKGMIDEVRIYNRVISKEEVRQIYQEFNALPEPEGVNPPAPYDGRDLSAVVDLESAGIWVEDEFDDPTQSGFSWAMKDQFKDGRITLEGQGKPCWGISAHKFNDFAVQVTARTSRDKHYGWGVCIYKHPEGEDAQGVEVLLGSEGMLSVIECRWTPAERDRIAPIAPIPVPAFKKGEFNTLVAAFSETRKLAVFVNGTEACPPIELPYILEPAGLQLASAGGASLPARLEFESFKVFSLTEKGNPKAAAEITLPKQAAPEPTLDTWTDTQGRQIKAIFLRLEGETLVVNFKEKETRLPLSRLSPESKALATKRQAEMNP